VSREQRPKSREQRAESKEQREKKALFTCTKTTEQGEERRDERVSSVILHFS
jgi:hypothetical protein